VQARHSGASPSCTARPNGPRHPSLGSIALHLRRGDRGGEGLTGSRNHLSPPPDAGSSKCFSAHAPKVLGTTSRWRASSRHRFTRGRATSSSSNDSIVFVHARPLRTCRRLTTAPALSAGVSTRRQRFKNPLQHTSPTRSSRMETALALQCGASASKTRASRRRPRTSLASATRVVSANRTIHSPSQPREGESGATTPIGSSTHPP